MPDGGCAASFTQAPDAGAEAAEATGGATLDGVKMNCPKFPPALSASACLFGPALTTASSAGAAPIATGEDVGEGSDKAAAGENTSAAASAAMANLPGEVDPAGAGLDGMRVLQCIEWIRDRVIDANIGTDDSEIDDDVRREAVKFLTSDRSSRLMAYKASEGGNLILGEALPPSNVKQFVYFTRANGQPVSKENIGRLVQYGKINSVGNESVQSLLRLMNAVYMPAISSNTSWPDSFRKEFSSQVHKFMATLTENVYEMNGNTVLYVPRDDFSDIESCVRDKDLVQRLETTLIHWTRQIKEVLTGSDSSNSEAQNEEKGPLAEIDYWRSRCLDLTSISEQLAREDIKTIVNVLDRGKSSYLTPFNELADQIVHGSDEAHNNLEFLQFLSDPCTRLASAKPKDISAQLPEIVDLIRMISSLSQHYNTPERIAGLLRKVSNEIILRCSENIKLDEIFAGEIEEPMAVLQQSIKSGDDWKAIYRQTCSRMELLEVPPAMMWNFDESRIFAQIDAFMQRCRDLLEVCESQHQFALSSKDMPTFSGVRGDEIAKSLSRIQGSFQRVLAHISGLTYDILDVKATRWHDDYNAFKTAVKDLEMMMQNCITSAFETVTAVEQGLNMLEAFHHLAKRDAIKRAVQNKASFVYAIFQQDFTSVSKEFQNYRSSPPIPPTLPQYAGSAIWARSLQKRLQDQMNILNSVYYLKSCREHEETQASVFAMSGSMDEYIKKNYQDWTASLDENNLGKLEKNLLVMVQGGYLEMNFDKGLLRLFEEVRCWEKLMFPIPHAAMEMSLQREKFRQIRDNVMLVVRDYNQILDALSDKNERRLFQEKMRNLTRVVTPGVSKLQWGSRGIVDYYCRSCRTHSEELHKLVNIFKSNNQQIAQLCAVIGETLLVKIESKQIYEEGRFEHVQAEHRAEVKEKLKAAHERIKQLMASSYEMFSGDNEDIQKQWQLYVVRIDKMVEEGLRSTVRKSLQDISRVINGDARTEVQPIFRVKMTLEKDKVDVKPTMNSLTQMVNTVSKELITVLNIIPLLKEGGDAKNTFYARISNDEDILKIMVSIMGGMSSNLDKLQKYLTFWEKYKHTWDYDKDAYMRRYAKANRTLTAFEADIQRYKDLQSEIQAEETIVNMNFICIDCSPLKQSIVGHCVAWQGKFTSLLHENAHNSLKEIRDLFSDNTSRLAKVPTTLEELADSINHCKKLQVEKESILARFEPLYEEYKLLQKCDIQIPEEEKEKVESLQNEYNKFGFMLSDSERTLNTHKDKMKGNLMQSLEDFKNTVAARRKKFLLEGPFEPSLAINKAFDSITQWRAWVQEDRDNEAKMQGGVDLFALDRPVYKDLAAIEKDMDLLQQVWDLSSEWNDMWENWKLGRFTELQVDSMEEASGKFNKKLQKLGKDIKVWKTWEANNEKVKEFKKALPLITDLRNEALRDRHWQQLMDHIGQQFDPTGPDFTLAKVVELGLPSHGDLVGTLSNSASKELMVEKAISNLESVWGSLNLDIMKYKNEYRTLRSADEIFANLEDNVVTLSTMKASKFALSFLPELEKWEATLNLVSETIEAIQNVQRAWMYLENIFVGSEDIRKQLPAESKMFDGVNTTWKQTMKQLEQEGNVVNSCRIDGMLDSLNDMESKLEKIQKSLDQYLETKRQAFPRFYFISNDDLLEILGQARDPEAVQPHLKKCFEAIKTLKMEPPGKEGRRNYEALGMNSPDGEYAPFTTGTVVIEGAVETWLLEIESVMRSSLRKTLNQTLVSVKGTKRDKWVNDFPGQLLITAGQTVWTTECEKGLAECEKGNRAGMRTTKKKQVSMLNQYAEMVRGQMSKLNRNKVVAIITIEVHARDVIEKMIKAGTTYVTDFDWMQQLRFYWDKDIDDSVIRQTNTMFIFGYEYQGNNGRLVITPLTDRCYMTLTTALHLKRGGNPLGPAGTGKTETVKDLGKSIAMYVIVFNCSDQLDYKSVGRMFSGLCQQGAWACFDEFNRILVEVLSVIAQQMLQIFTAVRNSESSLTFEGVHIKLNLALGIFVTMNPGYAGRAELPDNLKALVRPIAMMVPDLALIAEIMLGAEGFLTGKVLGKKLITLYQLMQQQMSKQDHYDYGMRAIKAVLVVAGAVKRVEPEMPEEVILLRAVRDMSIPKLVGPDVPLFNALCGDLFPGVEMPVVDYGEFLAHIKDGLTSQGLQHNDNIILKIIQTYEANACRHGNMLVGRTMTGKSTAWRTLQMAHNSLKKAGIATWEKVVTYCLNPKAFSLDELFGGYNLVTREWTDGTLSNCMREACADEKMDWKWLLLDGPVDTLWIESMNTVLDDNKLLTLISGERISMPPMVKCLFEVEDLSVASPATVSRAGMIYCDISGLGWRPYIDSWLQAKEADEEQKESVPILASLIEKFFAKFLEFKRLNVNEMLPLSQCSCIASFCKLYDAVATPQNGVKFGDENCNKFIEMWFMYSVAWSLGGAADEAGRKKLDQYIRELDAQLPAKGTLYDFFVDVTKVQYTPWDEKVNAKPWRPLPDAPFFKLLVPTIDSTRNAYLLDVLMKVQRDVIVSGPVGCGKTSVIQQVLAAKPDSMSDLAMQFSAQTSSNRVQEIIEGAVEKRTKDTFAPPLNKKMIIFVDDMNMPQKDTFGSMPPLELLKCWMEYGYVYDRLKQMKRFIKDCSVLGAVGPPGGGRNFLPPRFQSKFHTVNFTFPDEASVKRIFSSLVNMKLSTFPDEVKPLGDLMTTATIEIYDTISEQLLPTPMKSHYVFNMRDLSKVFQGVLRADQQFVDSKDAMIRLWMHECFRVFSDRLTDDADRNWFRKLAEDKLNSVFDATWKGVFDGKENLSFFADFMRSGYDPAPYEEVADEAALKSFVEEKLEEYNFEPGFVPMNLVLFRDALGHLCRISRVIKLPRGNALLVGVGGSGRQSLARLASYIAEYKVFMIEISKTYRVMEFKEDLKKLFEMAGAKNQPTVFLFNDTQVIDESFLEDINGLLGSGEVPNLFGMDEINSFREAVRADARAAGVEETPAELWNFFIERCRTNLHLVLCMSPIGEAFRTRVRMFPNLVNCCTIDWFSAWSPDALKEVAIKFMGETPSLAKVLEQVSSVFALVHKSVISISDRLLAELKRNNYVTPTNYLELVKGYLLLLGEKRQTLEDGILKFRNGIEKLDDSKAQVEVMSEELEVKKVEVAQAQKDCEEMLVVIVKDRKVVDEQQKSVEAESEKIQKEEAETKIIADDAQRDLDEALPALAAAEEALGALNKKDLSEIKAYTTPPDKVEMVLECVMVFLKKPAKWADAKAELGNPSFLTMLKEYDKDANLNDAMINKVSKWTSRAEFEPDVVGKQSGAAKSLCMWCRAMVVYGRVAKNVAPKKAKLQAAMDTLKKKRAQLQAAQDELQAVTDKMMKLKAAYDESNSTKERLVAESAELEAKLDRAQRLVGGLGGERSRWDASATDLENRVEALIGDCAISAAFLSYGGPFNSEYRGNLLQDTWLPTMRKLEVPASDSYSFAEFLADPSDVRHWNIDGLPSDAFSTENGVMVTRGRRWPLCVDPQFQANKWIKNLEKPNALKVVDLKMGDWMRQMENAIQFGNPVLIQDVQEELDPALEPVLSKSVTKKGNSMIIKLGDKEVDYNSDFKLYITTKLGNPHYTPEVSTKATVINFAVKEDGMEDQVLGLVVKKERADLEEKNSQLIVNVAHGKKTLVDLENKILYLLSSAKGSLLDDANLVETLQSSKVTSEEVTEQLKVAETTVEQIQEARESYRPCAIRSAILYFVVSDLVMIDPMYQFSLDAYFELYNLSIDKSAKSEELEERMKNINTYHTASVYRSTCRSLFEKHKLLFSLQMCVKILQRSGKINTEEYNFFLRGAGLVDKEAQPPNPAPEWISDIAWENLAEMDNRLAALRGVAASFEQNSSEWRKWYLNPTPEATPLPGEWENKCNELQRMLLIRFLRPDRVVYAVSSFVANNLGPKFVEPPSFDLDLVYSDSVPTAPLIFILSPGVDPVVMLKAKAETRGIGDKFFSLSLGQGQNLIADRMLSEGLKSGNWVFLANCHLCISYMGDLEKHVMELPLRSPHADFRLWLSSAPTNEFPMSILQAGLKITTEPPSGLKPNLTRLYNKFTEQQFERSSKPHKYKKMVFELCYFHATLLERKKFKNLGWNIPYDFNDSDFDICEDVLYMYIDQYEATPWEAIRYLIGEANYGGRVTDAWDRVLLNTYLSTWYQDGIFETENFKMSSLPTYYIPDDGPLQSHKDYINQLPNFDMPEAFGQHANADIASQIEDTTELLESVLMMQPRVAGGGGMSREDQVDNTARDLLEQVPLPMNLEETMKAKMDDQSALHVVLFQEVERYNIMLNGVRKDLTELRKAVKGFVVMTAELDDVFSCLFDGRIPPSWLKGYPSLKTLAGWARDLVERMKLFVDWKENTYPVIYNLGYFTFPTGFLTAVLQTSARKNSVSIDTLSWDFVINQSEAAEITQYPKEGVFIGGLFLEGAGWEHELSCLQEPVPMELNLTMPVINFKPTEAKKKAAKGIYNCPCYYYPIRTGTRERPSYMITVDLKSGKVEADHWIKRGTALLLSLAT